MSEPAVHIFNPSAAAHRGKRRRSASLPDFLRLEELEALFQAARSYWLNTISNRWKRARQRDWLMIQTAYYCGLRVAELCNLNVEDLDLAAQLLFVRKGKTGDGSVPVNGKLVGGLRDWVGERTSGILFPDPRGRHISEGHVRSRLHFLAKRAGIVRRVHPHALRHSCATHLLRGGANIYEVQRFLRHRSIQNTVIYLHLEPGRLREAAELL